MIRAADYIYQTLANLGHRHVFLVTGGGAMHLNDALGRETRLTYICNHHEQASAIAAEAYARITNQPGILTVTSGPGGINALNGVFGAWTDSIPLLVLSGQMKRETLLSTHHLTGKLRQLGDQEVDIIRMVEGITKYARLITDPNTIPYHLHRALHLATHGRPGPVWLDIPVDVQAALIDPTALPPYDPAEDHTPTDLTALTAQAHHIAGLLRTAQRPVILGGTGVRLSNAIPSFLQLAELLHCPVTTAWTHDLIPTTHPLYAGRQGTIGTRPGNFTVQNADLLLIIGSRLCIRQISYNWQSFARHATTIQVDIDPAELQKPTFQPQIPVHADARLFLDLLIQALGPDHQPTPPQLQWHAWTQQRLAEHPSVLPHHRTAPPGHINPYHLIELLSQASHPTDIFACGDATACITPFQALDLQPGQRLFSNSGSASMGYDLPAAIGASLAAPHSRIICLAGDGSIQMNLQELATIARHQLPIKIFALNNGGYLSIRSTQNNFFHLLVGEGPDSGLFFPDLLLLAQAYNITATTLDTTNPAPHLHQILNAPGPQICIVELDRNQSFEPKLSSKRLPDGRMVTAPLEDMAPFLDRETLRQNMIVPLLEE